MPQPTASDVHVNIPLTNISVAFMQRQENFLGNKWDAIPVNHQSNLYYIYPRGQWFRSQMQRRAPATESAGSGWELDTDTYRADKYSLHKDIADEERANQDQVIDMDRDATEWLSQQGLIHDDKLFVAEIFKTSTWTGSSTGGDITPSTKWDASGSTPITDIRAQIFSMAEKTGHAPTDLIMGGRVWEALQDNADFLSRIAFGTPGAPQIVSLDLLASILGLKRVLIGMGVENTATEGATDAFSFLIGGNAMLAYFPDSPSLLKPSAFYKFAWTTPRGSGPGGQRIKRFRQERLESDRVEIDKYVDWKVVASDLGVFFSNVLT